MTALPDDVRRLLDGPNPAHVATVLPDGAPHSVPVMVGREGDRVVFFTSLLSRKARNLERDPRVSVSLTDAEQPASMAQVLGVVVERVDGEPGWALIDRVFEKYTGQPYPQRTDRVAFLVEPRHAWARNFA